MEWDTVIGLEVHAQLKTKSKLFSGASTAYGASPNSQTCFIDAGLPGVLPVLNQEAVVMAIQFGLAIKADINDASVFERKNYFYPDLPKGYQISQFQKPIVSNGCLDIQLPNGQKKTITIARAHLEEDAGKSLHEQHSQYTGIDLNRAGTPLLEIVTTPCMFSAEEAIAYLKTLHQLVRFLGICDGNMQEGSFRCDVNLSLKAKGSSTLGTRTELKNLNSFRYIEKAIAYEQARHQELLENGHLIQQETRLYNADTHSTSAMRSKECENDYRYFPDPDLLPIQVTRYHIAKIKSELPRTPEQISIALQESTDLKAEDIGFILSSPDIYFFYKDIRALTRANDKLIVNWLKGQYAAFLNDNHLTFETRPVSAQSMANLLDKLADNHVSTANAKVIFASLWVQEEGIDTIIEREGLQPMEDNSQLEALLEALIAQYPVQTEEYRAGKDKLLPFFIGQIMKQTKGQANPEQIAALLNKRVGR